MKVASVIALLVLVPTVAFGQNVRMQQSSHSSYDLVWDGTGDLYLEFDTDDITSPTWGSANEAWKLTVNSYVNSIFAGTVSSAHCQLTEDPTDGGAIGCTENGLTCSRPSGSTVTTCKALFDGDTLNNLRQTGVNAYTLSFTHPYAEAKEIPPAAAEGLKYANALQVAVPAATCPYTPPSGVLEQRPIGSPLQGVIPFNKVPGDNYLAGRVFQLRKDGWKVEWQLVNDMSTTMVANPNRVFLIAVCVGLPQ